jgi:hypothetical protein
VRSRLGQSVALAALSALTAGCLVSAPIIARAMEQGLLRASLSHAHPADTAVTIRATKQPHDPGLAPGGLAQFLPAGAAPFFPHGIGSSTLLTEVRTRPTAKPSPVRVFARDDVCDHLTITSGRCATAGNEVMVSTADAAAWGWAPGTVLTVGARQGAEGTDTASGVDPPGELTVVGVYGVVEDPGYWLRLSPMGISGIPIAYGGDTVPGVDDLITAPTTFARGWTEEVGVALQYPLERTAFTLDSLTRADAAFAHLPATAGVTLDTPIARIVTSIRGGQAQVRFLVPVVAAQLALLTASVLVVVAQAAVEQRRREIALARLRGRSRAATRWLVMTELGAVVTVGLPIGVGLAALAGLGARAVLPPGIPFEVPWLSGVALVLAFAVSLVAVYAAARPVLREPVPSLLRAVRPAVGAVRLGPVDAVIVALAVVGVVGLASGSVSGPLAVLTPVLLALAAGGVGAAVVSGTVVRWGARRLGRGRLSVSLAALAAARRPALRWLLVVVSMTTAMTVFAADAAVVADRNRDERTRLEVGAPTVLVTDATNPSTVVHAVDGLGDLAARVAPVAVVRPQDATSTATLAMRPADLGRVAYAPPGQPPVDVTALAPPTVPTVELHDGTVTGTLRWSVDNVSGAVPRGAEIEVGFTITSPQGQQLTRHLAALPVRRDGSARFSAPLLCSSVCRLDGLWARAQITGQGSAVGTLTLSHLALDGAALDLGDGATWHAGSSDLGERLEVTSTRAAGDVDLLVSDQGAKLTTRYADVPVTLPVVLAGAPPAGADPNGFDIQNLAGIPTPAQAAVRVPALPEVGDRGALVNLDTLLRLGGSIPPTGSLEVWVDTEDPTVVGRVRSALAGAGVEVVRSRSYTALKAAYDESATAWGFALGLVGAAIAILIGALVMVVVTLTAWRRTARDLAALRVSGVPKRVLGRAMRLEHGGIAVAGVVVGALCGLGGGVVAMPLLPLFDLAPPPVPVPDLSPSWAAVGIGTALALAVFLGTGLFLARWLVGRAGVERIQESL